MATTIDAAQARNRPIWVPALDGIRGIVCVSIALAHIDLVSGWLPRHQFALIMRDSLVVTIELFFVMGGFFALLPAAHKGGFEGVRSYALRRSGRILPLYLLSLLAIVVLGSWLRPQGFDAMPHGVSALLVHIVFLQEAIYPGRTGMGLNLVMWSMTIAAMFYVTFPWVVPAYLRHPFWGMAIAVAISVGWRVLANGNDKIFEQYPLFVADFGVGMTASWLYVRAWRSERITPRFALGVVAIGIPMLLALMYLVGYGIVVEHQIPRHEHLLVAIGIPGVFAVLIATIPFLPSWAQWPLSNRAVSWVGEISYGVFLFHFMTIYLIIRVVGIAANGTRTVLLELIVLVLPVSFVFAWLATRYVERPARAWVRARASRLETRVPASAPPELARPAA